MSKLLRMYMQNRQILAMFVILLMSGLVIGISQQGFAFSQICINKYSGCLYTVVTPDPTDPDKGLDTNVTYFSNDNTSAGSYFKSVKF